MPGNVPQPPTGAQTTTISVTREEAEQIEGIVGMGFDRQTVLQAYLACDRNVERAVEFLLAGAFE
jgi:UV excision repair protein RAD23